MKAPSEMTDQEFIEADVGWLHYPMCPVKKRDGKTVGVIMTGLKTRVYLVNIWDHLTLAKDDIPFKDYASIEALVADGWVVD